VDARGRHDRRRDRDEDRVRSEADVIVDVEFESGLLFVVVVNVGDLPAHRVRVRFAPPFRGLGGARKASSAALFRRLEFLAPRKRIPLFLDRAALYFARGEPTQIDVDISWRADDGSRRRRTLRHDLEIYRDLTYFDREVPHARPS
jgi:hypothetical protein